MKMAEMEVFTRIILSSEIMDYFETISVEYSSDCVNCFLNHVKKEIEEMFPTTVFLLSFKYFIISCLKYVDFNGSTSWHKLQYQQVKTPVPPNINSSTS